MRKNVYSYVLTYDGGFAPNPFFDVCTLATCKPRIRFKAQVNDLILGWAGRAPIMSLITRTLEDPDPEPAKNDNGLYAAILKEKEHGTRKTDRIYNAVTKDPTRRWLIYAMIVSRRESFETYWEHYDEKKPSAKM